MKRILSIFALIFVFSACNEVGSDDSASTLNNTVEDSDSVTISALDTSDTSSSLTDYDQSSFSEYVYFHSTESKILIDYDFFPDGSDVCSQATYDEDSNPNGCQVDQTVVVPCDFSDAALDDDMLSFNVSASDDDSCEDDIVVDFSDAEFTTDGLVFDFSDTLDSFDSDFEFKISEQGFIDSNDNSVLDLDSDAKLEDVYAEVISRQTD